MEVNYQAPAVVHSRLNSRTSVNRVGIRSSGQPPNEQFDSRPEQMTMRLGIRPILFSFWVFSIVISFPLLPQSQTQMSIHRDRSSNE
jgi:hypothetical protein